MKASDAAVTVSTFLADQLPGDEYSRWSEGEMLLAFRWALAWVSAAKPNSFIMTTAMTLQAGSQQHLPSCCNGLTDTVANLNPVSRRAQRLVSALRNRTCPGPITGSEAYKPTSFSYDTENPRNIYIYPPVPASAAGATLDVVCSYTPTPSSMDEDVPGDQSVFGAVVDLMIYHLGSGENESATLTQVAQSHYRSALDQMRLNEAADEREAAEVDRGQVNV